MTRGLRPGPLEVGEAEGAARLRVDLIERLGADTLVHGRFGAAASELTVRVQGVRHFARDAAIPVRVDPEHLHLFERASGRRIEPGG